MKKRTLYIILGIIILFNIHNVHAALGITPALIKVDFEPNKSLLVNFNVLSAEPDQNLVVYADGDFKDYVRFDKINFTGREVFTAYIDLPEKAEKPGKNRLYIKVKEVNVAEGGIGTALEVGALIIIKVPYPGKYAEIDSFNVNDLNEGGTLYFSVNLNNLGEEEITSSVDVEVYSEGELFKSYPLGSKKIPKNTIESFEKSVESTGYKPGNYEAIAIVKLNDKNNTILKSNKTFRVGSLFVDIINWTTEVNKSKINPYTIEIESKWNNDLENVYAEVNVSKDNLQADFFKTPSVELKKWDRAVLKGFLNAENLDEGDYKANITIFYEKNTTSRIINLKIVAPEFPMRNYFIYIILIILAAVVSSIIAVYLLLKSKKNAKRKKR